MSAPPLAIALLLPALLLLPAATAGKRVAKKRPAALPDLYPVTSALNEREVVEESGRRVLRFSSVLGNRGTGPLEVTGKRRKGRLAASQVLYNSRGGRAATRSIGEFEYHPEHGHWHLLRVAEYRLLDATGQVVSRSDKISFCLRDSRLLNLPLPGTPGFPVYGDCSRDPAAKRLHSGISVGWGDYYGKELDGQSLDVTGLPPGSYTLVVEADPDGLMEDADRSNNTAGVEVELPD